MAGSVLGVLHDSQKLALFMRLIRELEPRLRALTIGCNYSFIL